MSLGLIACDRCVHRRGLHKGGKACSVAGCTCEAFLGVVESPAPKREELEGKLLTIVVPDGFVVTVTLYPERVDQAEETEEAAT